MGDLQVGLFCTSSPHIQCYGNIMRLLVLIYPQVVNHVLTYPGYVFLCRHNVGKLIANVVHPRFDVDRMYIATLNSWNFSNITTSCEYQVGS